MRGTSPPAARLREKSFHHARIHRWRAGSSVVMKNKLILASLTLAALAPLSALAGGIDINLFGEIRLGNRLPPPPPVVVVVTPDPTPSGPGEWEHRSRWYQRSYGYYYYPGADVYY